MPTDECSWLGVKSAQVQILTTIRRPCVLPEAAGQAYGPGSGAGGRPVPWTAIEAPSALLAAGTCGGKPLPGSPLNFCVRGRRPRRASLQDGPVAGAVVPKSGGGPRCSPPTTCV